MIRKALFVTVWLAGVASAEPVVQGQAEVVIEPAAPVVEPAGQQGVFGGYRVDMRGEAVLQGVAFHGLWGRPASPFEAELMTTFGWGITEPDVDARRLGQWQLSFGYRYVANKQSSTRPYAVVAPVFVATRIEDEPFRLAVGAEVGLGVQRALRDPGAISFDVRVARTRDLADGALGPWNVFATLSIGLYFPRDDRKGRSQFPIPVAVR